MDGPWQENMARSIMLLAVALLCIAVAPPESLADTPKTTETRPTGSKLVIVGATLIDGTGAEPIEDSVIVIDDGIIEWIGTAAEYQPDSDAIRVDAQGKFIVPGIVDAHAHVDSIGGIALPEEQEKIALDYYPRAFLFNGVTTLLNMSAHDTDRVLSLRNDVRRDPLTLAPRIYTGASTFTVAGGWGGRHGGGLESSEQIGTRLQEYAERDVDLVKIIIEEGLGAEDIFPRIPADYIAEITRLSEMLDLPVFIHATDEDEYLQAISFGPRAMAHGLFTPQSAGSQVIQGLQERDIFVVPTIVLFEAFYAVRDNPALLDDPLLEKCVPDFILESMRQPGVIEAAFAKMDEILRMDASAWARSAVPDLKSNVKLFAESGIRIAVGTDGGGAVVHSFQGYNTPREMEILAKCCLSNMDTIVAATRTAAEIMGAEDVFGTIRPGRSADLLILNADPLVDIRAVRDFDHLVLRGQVLERSQLSFAAFRAEPDTTK